MMSLIKDTMTIIPSIREWIFVMRARWVMYRMKLALTDGARA